jgi:competence protein ComEC
MKIRRIASAAFLVLALGSGFAYALLRSSGLLEVHFLDIGQGDAIYVRTPSGRDMLIDGGPSRILLPKLAEVMPFHDRSIDVVVETHPDADHIGGLPHLLERYHVGFFLEPGIESKNAIDDELRRLIKERNIEKAIARRGMKIDFGDGTTLEILYPDGDVSGLKDTNEASIVAQLRYGSTAVMLTGDASKRIENVLISTGIDLGSDILKAGHHGSRTSSGEGFVKAVSPKYAVISVGRDNRYSHPHKEVVEVFEKSGIRIFRTDLEGTIRFISDGIDIFQK